MRGAGRPRPARGAHVRARHCHCRRRGGPGTRDAGEQYSQSGSSSVSRAWRPAFTQAIKVLSDPRNGSTTMSWLPLELGSARHEFDGFTVGCRLFERGFLANHTSP